MERKHSDVLIAGLILVGATTWLRALAQQLFVLDYVTRAVILFVAACGAAQFARRLLPELDFGKTAIAATVSMAIGIGVFAHRIGEPMNIDTLIAIGVALGGAIVGALTSRHRGEPVAKVWLVLGGGFAGFGAAILMIGMTMIVADGEGAYLLALLGGATGGALLAGLFTPVRGRHAGLGLGIGFAILMGASTSDKSWEIVGVVGLLLGSVLGAIGGGIGARIADRRKSKPHLPEAHVR